MSDNSGNGESIIKFPCDFTVKVIGHSDVDLKNAITDIIKTHCPKFDGNCTERPSSNGKYTALTFVVPADSKAQMDQIYLTINRCEHVVMTL